MEFFSIRTFTNASRRSAPDGAAYPRFLRPLHVRRMSKHLDQGGHGAPQRAGVWPTETERRTGLARLLPLWPHEIADFSPAGRRRIVSALARSLREERRRGRAGHWTYDLARHAQLARAWRAEKAELAVVTLRSGTAG